jgi:hypothetical protein
VRHPNLFGKGWFALLQPALEPEVRIPPELKIFKGLWIYILGVLITAAVLLTWYHLDPTTPAIALH